VLSWNVHGASSDKLEDNEFIKQIAENDVIFLYETWSKIDSTLDITGYKCYNFYRKFQNRRAKRCSGGVAVYIKNELVNGVKVAKSLHDSIIWLKLEKEFFDNEDDIYIGGAYVWVENSPAYNVINCDFFQLLQEDIYYFTDLGKVIICGDLNARVGKNRHDFVPNDRQIDYLDGDIYIPDDPPPRASMDTGTNAHGLRLLDLCKATSMRIANGRLDGDLSGSFTYMNTNGASVIDYLLIPEHDFNIIKDFKVKSFNEWSDHAPLFFKISCHKEENMSDVEDSGTRNCYEWNDTLKEAFRSNLISKLTSFNQVIHRVNIGNKDSVNDCVNEFTDILRSVADPLFSKEKRFGGNEAKYVNPNRVSKKAEWFDDECITAKNIYHTALFNFNRNKINTNRIELCNAKSSYKILTKKKKRKFEYHKTKQIERLRHSKPKDFWRLFSNKKKKTGNIKLEEFFEYFSNLNADLIGTTVQEAEDFVNAGPVDPDDPTFEELDKAFTFEEIQKVIHSLKRNKAYGIDCLPNEYFMESYDIIGGHLVDLFNTVLNSGFFPEKWSEGIILPLHKHSDPNDVNNYRGITLVSCLAKIFTGVLNKRINNWIENNNILSDTQFGFRSGRSTVDAIFVLNATIQKILNEKTRLYCAFIDLKKAFDSIYLNGMWLKLSNLGINGKLLNIIKSMYNKVRSCVQGCNSYSEYFECAVGLKQGEVLSPVLFSLFLDDLELFLQNHTSSTASGLTIEDITFILMLFADDMVIFGKTAQDLQNSLDQLKTYCDKWGLAVNTKKTKVMVFRKRGGIRQNEKWTFGEENLETVNDFNYLGTVFHYTGNFAVNQEYLSGKGLKALNTLFSRVKNYNLNAKTICQLFDAFVGATLNYSCEIWGMTKSKEIERIHLKFCKQLLHVKSATSNMAVYGELGRYPLYINRYARMIKFWCKILQSENIVITTLYKELCKQIDTANGRNWAADIKALLDNHGFSYVWNNPETIDPTTFPNQFKKRVYDTFIQSWNNALRESGSLYLYKDFKTNFEFETYLNLPSSKFRVALTRLRLSSHKLRVETDRYLQNRTERHQRYCLICNKRDIEDEYHFILVCDKYKEIRLRYIKPYYHRNPSVHKFNKLMQTQNRKILKNIGEYIYESLALRQSIVSNYQIQ